MKNYSNIGIKPKPYKIIKTQKNLQSLIDRELKDRVSRLESKLFESASRVEHAELRAGRSDIRAGHAEIRASQADIRVEEIKKTVEGIEKRSHDADRRAGEAELKARESREEAKEAKRLASVTEERCFRLEIKWQKITKIAKILLMPILFLRRVFKKAVQYLSPSNKIKVQVAQEVSDETIAIDQTQVIPPSPHTTHVYKNLENSISQKMDGE